MPTYNGAAFIGHALGSVAAQRDASVEIVAVDDGSTDGTNGILRAYASRLPLTIVEQPPSGNWVAATATGMAAARGEYLCWLHQDDAPWKKSALPSWRGFAPRGSRIFAYQVRRPGGLKSRSTRGSMVGL